MLSTLARHATKPKAVKTLPAGFVPRSAVPPPPPPPRPANANAPEADDGVRVGLRPPRTDRTRSVVDSFRSLDSNTRIAIGLVLGVIGFAGLWADRQMEEEEDAGLAGESPAGEAIARERKLPISLRVVDKVDVDKDK